MTKCYQHFWYCLSLLALNPTRFMEKWFGLSISGVFQQLNTNDYCPLFPIISAKAAVAGLIAGEGTYLFLYLITGLKKCNGSRSLGVVASFILCG